MLLALTFSNLPGCDCWGLIDRTPRSIAIVASFTDSTGKVLRFKPSANLNRRRPLHAMKLNETDWTRSRPGTTELIVAFLDASGALIDDALGFPGRNDYMLDRTTDRGMLLGGRRRPKSDVRLFHLPVPRRTRFVAFYKYRVHATDPRNTGVSLDTVTTSPPAFAPQVFLSKKILHVMELPSRFSRESRPRRPMLVALPAGPAASTVEVDFDESDDLINEPRYSVAVEEDAPLTLEGEEEIVLLRSCGDNKDCYNIVVVGDGFQSTQMNELETRATAMIDALLGTPPMSNHPDLYNVYLVKTPSVDSGVSCCGEWAGTERDTYFGARGQWLIGTCQSDIAWSGDIGMKEEGYTRLYDVAPEKAPYDEVHFYLVVTNCDTGAYGGGAAQPAAYAAFVTNASTSDDDLDVAVHECGHVMANLADEYQGCTHAAFDADYVYLEPNVAYLDDEIFSDHEASVAAIKSVPWYDAALESGIDLAEQDASGKFINVHMELTSQHNRVGTNWSEERLQVLFEDPGLYWACSYVNFAVPICQCLAADPCSDYEDLKSYGDERGNEFYRSAATCKMRRSSYSSFCLACAAALEKRLTATP